MVNLYEHASFLQAGIVRCITLQVFLPKTHKFLQINRSAYKFLEFNFLSYKFLQVNQSTPKALES